MDITLTCDSASVRWAGVGNRCTVVLKGIDESEVARIGGSVTAFRKEIDERSTTVCCKFCHEQVPAKTAHLHQEGLVGDECCWDERLRSSE